MAQGSLDVLNRFHDRHAGASDVVFGGADTGDGRSSYDRLFGLVPVDTTSALDLACGDGPMLSRLRGLPRLETLVGLDANATELAAAHRRLGGQVRLVRGLAQALPFADAAFDVVTCHMALMLMDEPGQVLAEVRRVLRPAGRLLFVVGRSAPMAPVEVPVWAWLRDRFREEGLKMTLGSGDWGAPEGLSARFSEGFVGLETWPLDARVRVPIAELPWFLERGYYPVDALSDAGKAALAAFVEAQAALLAPDGAIGWTFEMTLGSATTGG